MSNKFENKSIVPEDAPSYNINIKNILNERINTERSSSLSSLLGTLIATGLILEAIVMVASFFLAEKSIKPVREAYEAQKLFIANASHEIKTPLAAIEANLEAADIKGNHWIENVATETEKLSKLNSELLFLTKTDLEKPEKNPEKIDLKKFIIEKINTKESLIGEKTVKIIGKNHEISLEKSDFENFFDIFFENALKYSENLIEISINENILTIKNDGKKIPPEKLPHIFDRFYQADKSSDGIGLGLSIAKSLAEKNNWKISVASNSETIFKIVL